MAKVKFYVVWVGKKPGIYTSWAECQEQVHQFQGARFKSFETEREAKSAYAAGAGRNWGRGSSKSAQIPSTAPTAHPSSSTAARSSLSHEDEGTTPEYETDSLSVDVGCSGNPGIVEYKGVDTLSGEVVFSVGPISKGTNNLGEFLAIVHALAYLKKRDSVQIVYSDSRTAIKWVKQNAVVSTLKRDSSTEEIWRLVDRALHWLRTHTYENKVLKWETEKWGQIKADYGRKG